MMAVNSLRMGRLYQKAFTVPFDRLARRPLEAAVQDLTLPGDFIDENKNMFIDWNRLELYQLQRGEGECAI